MRFVNLCPHAVTFVNEDNETIRVVEPSGTVARLSTITETIGEMDGIPITQTLFGRITGLPEPEENTIYIVSALVAEQCPGRDDVFIPSESVRNSEGVIIGCKSLGRI